MSPIRTVVSRARGVDPLRLDSALALLLAAGGILEISLQASELRYPAVGILVGGLGTTLPIALRRLRPVGTAVTILACLGFATSLHSMPNDFNAAFFAILLAMYSMGAHGAERRALVGFAACLALAYFAIAFDPATSGADDYLFTTFFIIGLPFIAGRVLRNRRLLTVELRAKTERAERERDELTREAVTAERQRVARELHDVVAHSVSVMVIQATAAGRVMRHDRDGARRSLETVETTGREALAEMRRMVGVLRRGDEALALAPQPSMGHLATLVERARAAGLPVELRVLGEAAELPPGVDLAAYRVVQEALTNTIKHAGPARATVVVRYSPVELELEVSDDGYGPAANGSRPPGSGGHGLVGMRERLALYGGELEAARRRGGGFAVRARIPLNGLAA